MAVKIYKPSKLRRVAEFAFRGSVIICFTLGVGITTFALCGLGRYYIFEKPDIKRQQKEYAEAILRKEKREQELGLRD